MDVAARRRDAAWVMRVTPVGTVPTVMHVVRVHRVRPGSAGAVGTTAAGVTAAEAADAGDVPVAFVAVAVNVYAVPLVRPSNVQGPPAAPATVQVAPPGLAVTVNVSAAPPGVDPGPTVTVAKASPATAVGAAGVAGNSTPLVITRSPVPVRATDPKMLLAYVTEYQRLVDGAVAPVHVMPSVLVITRLSPPASATATNRPSPYVMPRQLFEVLPAGLLCDAQVLPSVLVITLPLPPTATTSSTPAR